MKTLKVINMKSQSKSFSWNDGLFAVKKKEGHILHLWKIKDGKLDHFENSVPNITCTPATNKGIYPTDLTIAVY